MSVGSRSASAHARHYETASMPGLSPGALDIICFSHLRWQFVFQRPQHLLSRAARRQRVFYFEEPMFGATTPWLELPAASGGVQTAIPHLPDGLDAGSINCALSALLDELMETRRINRFLAWYYTPMALPFSRHLSPVLTVYDCMDELSRFQGADSQLTVLESELFRQADVVFTGGHSLYLAKRDRHDNVYEFPSSIDVQHFRSVSPARSEPADQADLGRPRLGYYGVIDERLDMSLLESIARQRPDWQIIMVGPVVKIDPAGLPRLPNIHWLGSKPYSELPAYLAGWDVALMPFALNEATTFISPTKTLEYLAGRKPVVSTAIADVVQPYGSNGLVRIADSAQEFLSHCEAALTGPTPPGWLPRVERVLAGTSWDSTWQRMDDALAGAIRRHSGKQLVGQARV